MKIDDVTSGLRQELDERMAGHGFKFLKANAEYVRKQGDLRFIFCLGIHAKTDWFLVTPAAYVGSAAINKAFNEILGRSISTSGSTCGFGIGNECNHERGRYQIEGSRDVAATATALWNDYVEAASPFYAQVTSLQAIDEYMNTFVEGRCPAVSVSYACKALIVAKMVGNPRFEELAKTYYDFCATSQSPALAADIVAVRHALQKQMETESA